MIALTDLLEAEGRALKHSTVRTGVALACVGVTAVLIVAGVGLCVWAGYQYLALTLGPIKASLICGAGVLTLAGVVAWRTHRLLR